MDPAIDSALQFAFQPTNIAAAFLAYKEGKWDRFTGLLEPVINVPMGADGVTWQAFEKQIQRHARNISSRVLAGKYTFYPFREVDKPKNSDLPLSPDNKRTLGVASIRDALVQSVLYSDVLSTWLEDLFQKLDPIGPVSYAYRRGKSAPEAAKQIHSYIKDGYVHAYDFDLSKFFDRIPHDKLLQKVAEVIGGTDSLTYRLLRRFVLVDRVPHDTYRHIRRKDGKYIGVKLFHYRKPSLKRPKPQEGVPQGGVLSGMLANLYLHDFDKWVLYDLGSRYDLRYVRYADDFIIMVKNTDLLADIRSAVVEILTSADFKLVVNEHKTRRLDIRTDGLEFVGFYFDERHIRVKQANIDKFKSRLDETLNKAFDEVDTGKTVSKALNTITRIINAKIEGFQADYVCPRCQFKKRETPRNWTAFFSVITEDQQLHQLDTWIRRRIYSFIFSKYTKRVSRNDLRTAGLKSLVAERYKVHNASVRPCLCDMKAVGNNIWAYAADLYEGRKFLTLGHNRPFYVPHVGNDQLQVSVGGRQYQIGKATLQGLWDRLLTGEVLTRTAVEKNDGIRNSSHIVTLLSKLPGVEVERKPVIKLSFHAKSPAPFLQLSSVQ